MNSNFFACSALPTDVTSNTNVINIAGIRCTRTFMICKQFTLAPSRIFHKKKESWQHFVNDNAIVRNRSRQWSSVYIFLSNNKVQFEKKRVLSTINETTKKKKKKKENKKRKTIFVQYLDTKFDIYSFEIQRDKLCLCFLCIYLLFVK